MTGCQKVRRSLGNAPHPLRQVIGQQVTHTPKMIETNLLLVLSFSLITNFASKVPIPAKDVPKSPNAIRLYRVGTVRSPTDVMTVGESGALFWVVGGVVQYFQSPENYFNEQDPRELSHYFGTQTLTLEGAIILRSPRTC